MRRRGECRRRTRSVDYVTRGVPEKSAVRRKSREIDHHTPIEMKPTYTEKQVTLAWLPADDFPPKKQRGSQLNLARGGFEIPQNGSGLAQNTIRANLRRMISAQISPKLFIDNT